MAKENEEISHREYQERLNHEALFMLTKDKFSDMFEDAEESEDSDISDFELDMAMDEKSEGPNSQRMQNFQNPKATEQYFKKFANKINVEKYEVEQFLPSGVGNRILANNKKIADSRNRVKDKQDRATVEQVLDPRTRMILYKLINNEKILEVDGCISTGKEANVYHATGPDNSSYAIKIFKTSILTFKTRDKYVSGEFRFKSYCKSNPRKMVRLWAEKEFRNLHRIYSSGKMLSPRPIMLKSHVLMMDFIGEDGWPSPLLKDVKFDKIEFSEEEGKDALDKLLLKLYKDCLRILFHLFKSCKLVHADFSEFNLILKDYKDLYVIDVSQSVEHDHPRSLDFLRNDIKNIQEYFGKRGIMIGDFQEIFNFITSPLIDESNFEDALNEILRNSKSYSSFDVNDEVFRQSYIPRKMDEVFNHERDIKNVKSGDGKLIYTNIMGLEPNLTITNTKENNIEEEDSQGSTSSDSEEDDEDSSKFVNASRPKNETMEEKKERKNKVKSEKAEKRKEKMKKHIKKRKEKMAHANSKKK